MMKKNYTLLNHTADLRVRVFGNDPADLFTNAGLALFDLIAGPLPRSADQWLPLTVSADDRADLLINFLRELLYLWTGEDKLVSMVRIETISETGIEARVGFVDYLPGSHAVWHEIKAVTYHQIEVKRTPSGWQATVVFDI
jgi:SHS2 domain-containing protein